jgi:hypothetical protein
MAYMEQLQRIANQYLADGHSVMASAHEMAIWAVETKRWEPQRAALINQCAEELSRAMREEYFTDPQGRRVRAKHVARRDRDGKQMSLWADIRLAPRDHMETAFQQRRQQIVGDCHQLKVDVDSYNQNFNPGEAIQMVFDFRDDLAEIEVLEAFSSAS